MLVRRITALSVRTTVNDGVTSDGRDLPRFETVRRIRRQALQISPRKSVDVTCPRSQSL